MSKIEMLKVRWVIVRLDGSLDEFIDEGFDHSGEGDGSRPRGIPVKVIGNVSTPDSEAVTGYGHVIFATENSL